MTENQTRAAALAGGTALLAFGASRRGPLGWVLAAGGATLAGAALVANRPRESEDAPGSGGARVRKSVTIYRPRNEVYAFWRDFENLPRFMNHLESVETFDGLRSKWVAKAPAGRTVEWEAEIVDERPDELIVWRSLPGADVDNDGSVAFLDAPGGRGTEVRVEIAYRPPAGPLGRFVAKAFGEEPEGQVADDLRRLRALLETGSVPTTEGQPSDVVRKTKGYLGVKLTGPGLPLAEARNRGVAL